MRITDTDASELKGQAKGFTKLKPTTDKLIEQEKQRSFKAAPDVSVEEWDTLLKEYIKGSTQYELSHRYGIKLQVIGHKASANRWAVKRARQEAREAKTEANKLRGLAEAGQASVAERKAQEQVDEEKTERQKKAEAISKSNERTSLFLDRTMELMALALGITDADYLLFADNPALMLQKTKAIAEDKDQNANFVRLLDKFKEVVVLKRLVSGQSTSAANRDDPIESDEQERVVFSLAQVQQPEGELIDLEKEVLADLENDVLEGDELDFL